MMSLGPLGFLSPGLLAVGLVLPIIWWLLRITPPSPDHIFFPATRLLVGIKKEHEDTAHSPWWLTLLRLLAAGALILAMARPVLNPQTGTLDKSDLTVVLIDNGWAAAGNWLARRSSMMQLLDLAEQDNRPVLLLATANPDERQSLNPLSAFKAREQFSSLTPHPFAPDRLKTLSILKKAQFKNKKISLTWLSDGLDYGHAQQFAAELAKLADGVANLTIIKNPGNATSPIALYTQINKKGNLQAIINSPGKIAHSGQVVALDAKGRAVLEKPFKLTPQDKSTSVDFDLPLELRNQITRMEIRGQRSASTTYLVDGRANWQRIGLISGEAVEESQPLLSPLYYIKKALKPYSEISQPDNRNTAKATKALLSRDISTLILAGIGRLERNTAIRLEDWLERGGVVVRFAGPRLEQGGDDLLPVQLRKGGRALGGALSWSKPQKLADFEQDSPFFALQIPKDVSVRRQVLADPSMISDDTLVWARLKDGTPLVTARKIGRGLLVLFHVTANSTWSNLPHSGLFVGMLRRLVELSGGVLPTDKKANASAEPSVTGGKKSGNESALPALPPLKILDGFGAFSEPSVHTEPVKITDLETYMPSAVHPPGLYGTLGHARALNIAAKDMKLIPLPPAPKGVFEKSYSANSSKPLAPLLLTLALILFLADGLIVALMRGLFSPGSTGSNLKKTASAAIIALVAGAVFTHSSPAQAAPQPNSRAATGEAFSLSMSLDTHLAYVITGEPEIDRVSQLGLKALSKAIGRRTAFEPSIPVGIDISKDELAFFPLLYWAVPQNPKHLDSTTVARINAYMKQGGVILFDTRDQMNNFMPKTRLAGQTPLAKLLARMDIPRLEPVPSGHVLTRSFYLLDSFPGRWSGGTLWVEASDKSATRQGSGSARSSDGVSSILITSNNLAAAWATDENGRTLFAVSPDGERQREMSYRTGINIVMYALTGNYKADQVHLPALMRRLGQ